jgi:hypothetical protein
LWPPSLTTDYYRTDTFIRNYLRIIKNQQVAKPRVFRMGWQHRLATSLVVMGLACPAFAGNTIAVMNTADLRFGTMVVINSGTLIVHPQTGMLGGTAWVVHPPSVFNQVGAAEFIVTCVSDAPITYTVEIINPNTGNLLRTSDITDYVTYSSLLGNPSLSKARSVNQCFGYSETIRVGATLTLNSSQPGSYNAPGNVILQANMLPN